MLLYSSGTLVNATIKRCWLFIVCEYGVWIVKPGRHKKGKGVEEK